MSQSLELSRATLAIMAQGSKSFDFAARLLPAESRKGARYLYAWCRHCDDVVDLAPGPAEKLANVARLERLTHEAFAGRPAGHLVFLAFAEACAAHAIPREYPLDLLAGMRADAEGRRYETLAELERYGYEVAGTVGLMMCHVMGVSHERALGHAVDLGVAMQLTNIARDVGEDHAAGRLFLPRQWLREAGIPEAELMHERHRPALVGLVSRLLARADEKYRSGVAGLRYLPWRSALAIRVAAGVYAGIGAEVLARGRAAWEERCFTTRRTKLRLALGAALRALSELPGRLRHPWRPQPVEMIWRPR